MLPTILPYKKSTDKPAVYPIFAYGQPVLKQIAQDIPADHPDLPYLVESMFETMYNAKGVGLAGPQIGINYRIFVIDSTPFYQDEDGRVQGNPEKMAIINAQKIEEEGDEFAFQEGCLSIPGVTGDVYRPDTIKVKYLDEHFKEHTRIFKGMNARVIQHEYDHIDGILFTELVGPLKKQRIRNKLAKIKKGKTDADYQMVFI